MKMSVREFKGLETTHKESSKVWYDNVEYRQMPRVVNTAGKIMGKHKARKADLYNIMDPSYQTIYHIHTLYIFKTHRKKIIWTQLLTDIQNNSEIFIHLLANIF